jgi:hypothetical protein
MDEISDPKRSSACAVVRYRGLAKNLARAQTMFALANLYQVRHQLLPAGARCVWDVLCSKGGSLKMRTGVTSTTQNLTSGCFEIRSSVRCVSFELSCLAASETARSGHRAG